MALKQSLRSASVQRLCKIMTTNILELSRCHPLIAFTGLAYAFSWLLWGLTSSSFMVWLGGFGPALAAFVLTALLEGRDGLRRLLAQIFVWRVSPFWYLAALGLPFMGTLAVSLLYALEGDSISRLQGLAGWLSGLSQHYGILGLTLVFGVFVVAGEEFGWRGFVLPKLQEHHTDLYASLTVGLMWGLWHLPTLWPFQQDRDVMDLLLFIADILAVSVIYTWLYTNSHGSLLLICLFHSAYDVMVIYASATLPFLGATRGYELLVMLMIAGASIVWTGPVRFRRTIPNTAGPTS